MQPVLPLACLAMLFAAPRSATAQQSTSTAGSTEAVDCGEVHVPPGEKYDSPDGVSVKNWGEPGDPWITVWTMPADGSQPERTWVRVPAHGHADVGGVNTSDTVTVGSGATVNINCDNFKDHGTATSTGVAPGGINIEGNNATVNVNGSGNDVDFHRSTTGSDVNFAPGGTNNDIDLNGTTGNTVTPAAGQNIHN